MRILILSVCALVVISCQENPNKNIEQEEEAVVQDTIETVLEYGFDLSKYEVVRGEIQRNDFLSTILSPHGIGAAEMDKLVNNTRDIFDVRKIRPGNSYAVICEPGDSTACHFVYEQNAVDYVVFNLRDSLYAYEGQKPVEINERSASGSIESSLYMTCKDIGIDASMAMDMANIYAWSIDFYHIQRGDKFEVLFEEKSIDGEVVGTGKVVAANFWHKGTEHSAFYFEQGEQGDYFDNEGNSLRKAFLQSPLKFGRISSSYSKKRFHPILKRNKAHLGTDYAAPHGTPILAVGDGEVIKSAYKGGNGNYVKIRHNSTYDTQYLHMSKRAVKVGDYVRQGDVIGYVGSTGLATGPHVCFRFWKNGEQVDHRKEKFPPSEPIKDAYRANFEKLMKEVQGRLKQGVKS